MDSIKDDADFAKVFQQVAQAANKSSLSLRDIAAAMKMNNVPAQTLAAKIIIRHNPSWLPRWQGLAITPEGGCFGRICWINSRPSEETWGRTWWNKYL